MASKKLDPKRRGLNGYQGFFLALTLIVMIIIVLTTKELTTAILLIGLIITSQLTLLGDRHLATSGDGGKGACLGEIDQDLATSVMVNPAPGLATFDSGSNLMASLSEPMARRPGARPPQVALNAPHLDTPPRGARERFTGATTAPPGAGPPAFPNIPETTTVAAYPGAIDFGETDVPVVGDEAPALGHVDWDAAARDGAAAPPQGNPYDLDRIANPQAAAPCVDDDAIAIYDGDELMAYQARSRNDPERVWAGIYRRKALVDRYVREELDERENTQWWGAGEV
jgi:hypothetical protein